MSSIGIGIPVYNDCILINYLLDSIDIYTDRNLFKIVVLDDGSSGDNQKAVKKICDNHNVDFIYHDKNIGVPKSWNDLIEHLNTDYIILLNNDIVVFKNWFESIKFFLENNPEIGTVSLPMIIVNREDIGNIIENLKINHNKRPIEVLEPCTRIKRIGVFDPQESNYPSRIAWPMCVFGFSRKAYDSVKGFNEAYHAFYEEVDFGISLYQKGYPSYVLSGPHIYHVWGATFQTNQQINSSQLLNNSRKVFMSKYGKDYIDIFKTLNHNFDTTISYLEGDTQKSITLNNTYFTDWCKQW